MHRYDSSQKINKNSKKATINIRSCHNSMHRSTQRKSEHVLDQKTDYYILPALNYKSRTVPVYLLYKGHKFVIKSYCGMAFKQLIQLLYQQIACFQSKKHTNKNKDQVQKSLREVLGFSTICNNLKIDYLLSIMHGQVQKSLLLECFIKRKHRTKNNRTYKQKAQNLNNQSFNTKKPQNNQSKYCFNYQIYNCLAIGGFSKVYLARSYNDGRFYAIKFIKKRKQREDYNRNTVINQMEICSQLNHPFLIKMREGFQTSKFFCMVFQYCPGGQLFFLLKKIRTMSQQNARLYFIQILLGIKHIHDKNIIYRDLKPQNILIDCEGYLKIVDFGLSKKVISCRQKTFSYCGSAEYMAPEMILRSGHNSAIDYYSLGALLFELVTGLPPFYSKNQQELQQSIVTQRLCFPKHIPLSEQIKDILSHLLAKDQRFRLGSYAGIKQIMIHPWVGKFNTEEYLNKKKIKIPFPPNLSEYNFDTQQLGDDQQQFSNQIYKEFGFNTASNQINFYIKAQHEQKFNYQDIITKILLQFSIQKLQQQNIIQRKRKNNEQIAKIYRSQNITKKQGINNRTVHQKYKFQEQPGSMNNTVNTASLTKCSKNMWKKKVQQQSFNSQKYSQQKQNKDPGQKINKLKKDYEKLLPYFCKNKPYRAVQSENKKILPRANILRLKVSVNQLKQQSVLQNT